MWVRPIFYNVTIFTAEISRLCLGIKERAQISHCKNKILLDHLDGLEGIPCKLG